MPDSRDPQSLRALAHPLRWKLLDLLLSEGTATATRCAEDLGESVASCSYHLRMLAKYGFVWEVTGPGREKPWTLTSPEQDLSPTGQGPAGELAAEAATEVFLDHELARLKDRLRRKSSEPAPWRAATGLGGVTTFLTAEELHEVTDALGEIACRHAGRVTGADPVPEGAREVRIFVATSVAPPRHTQDPDPRDT